MNVIILTNNGSLFGKKIINEFLTRHIEFQGVVVINQPLKYYINLFKYVKKRVGFIEAFYFSLRQILSKKDPPKFWNNQRFLNSYGELPMPVNYVSGTNTDDTIDTLRSYSPDIIILGQTGIVRKKLLQLPKIGILNAHPGILPLYRGIDCAAWAIYNNDFSNLGATVHWVDAGVDTGNLILQKHMNIMPNDTLESIDDRLYDLCASLLADVILESTNKRSSGEVQKKDAGQQYYKMPLKKEKIARKNLSEYLSKNFK